MPNKRGHRGCSHAMLAGAGLGDQMPLAHAAGQQDLAQDIVDLVGAGVVEVFPFEVNREAQLLADPSGFVQERGAAGIFAQQTLVFLPESRILPRFAGKPVPGSVSAGIRVSAA